MEIKINRYSDLYYQFFCREIPNFIQIIGLTSILGALLPGGTYRILNAFVTSWLLDLYLIQKVFDFMLKQIIEPYSEINRHKLSDELLRKHFLVYIIITTNLFAIIIWFLSGTIVLR